MGDGQGTGDVLWGQEASQGRKDAGTQDGIALSPAGQEGVSGSQTFAGTSACGPRS